MKSDIKHQVQCVMLAVACFGIPLVTYASDLGSVLPNGNTADGSGVLFSRTTGIANSGFGFQSLFHDTTGSYNTATGYRALFNDTTGYSNTADGYEALYSDTTGIRNTAVGTGTLLHNNANANTAVGWGALFSDTTGTSNTALGDQALYAITYSSDNTAVGYLALRNSVGDLNTAIGYGALSQLTSGLGNVAIGSSGSLTVGSDNIYISVPGNGITTESNTIRIGGIFQTSTFIGGIWNTNEGGSNIEAVYINSDGRLGTQAPPSSRRYKKDIRPMNKASEAILSLKPVTFQYKADAKETPQFGLIAEEVAELDPDLVIRDEKGEIYSVRYDAVNAMLLNEFLKEHRKMQEQEATIAQLKAGAGKQEAAAAHQQKQIEALTAGLQKVSAQIEMSRPAPQTVVNNQ
jgi:uncharacterized coiled-coil protein SlyX